MSNFIQPCESPFPVAFQLLVTELDPFCQDRIDHPTYTNKRGTPEFSVVIQPSPDSGITEYCQFLQLATCPCMQFPRPDFILDCLFCLSAYGGGEAHKELSLAIFRKPWFECKSQEIELGTCIPALPVCVLTVNNLRLFRVCRQPAFFQSMPYGFEKLFSFLECSAMDDNIVGIPCKRICRMFPLHPFIERVM